MFMVGISKNLGGIESNELFLSDYFVFLGVFRI